MTKDDALQSFDMPQPIGSERLASRIRQKRLTSEKLNEVLVRRLKRRPAEPCLA